MLRLDIPITKVDAARRLVFGVATAEVADRAGEICDYASTKPLYEKWSEAIATSSGGKSFGNLRAMHGQVAAGKVTALTFNDEAKQIEICAKVVDDAEWTKVEEGVYTGFSQGGSYAKRWTDEAGAKRYTAEPHEISLVDLPCLAEARFEMIKRDGSREYRPFRSVPPDEPVMLDKIGARNSAEDQTRIQAMHDTSVELGASCGAEKAHAAGFDLAKLESIRTDLNKHFEGLGESLAKSIGALAARLDAVERQPMPLPFAMQTRSVSKGDDGLAEDRVDALLDDPGALSLLAIKLAQRQGK
jgi:hypothetical protein